MNPKIIGVSFIIGLFLLFYLLAIGTYAKLSKKAGTIVFYSVLILMLLLSAAPMFLTK